MKRISLILCMAAAIMPACAQQPKTATITGDVKSLPDGITIQLLNAGTYTRSEVPVAETVVDDNKFTLTLEIEEPRFFCLEAGPQYGNFWFVVGPGDNFTIKGDTFRNVEVAGSETYAKYEELYLAPNREYFRTARNFPEEERPAEFAKYLENAKKTIAANSDNFIAPVMIYQLSGNIPPTEEAYASLSDKIKSSQLGRYLRAYLDTFIKGKQAPKFTAKDRDGKEYSLSGLLEGNKYLVIDFWASWCAPCRKGIPEMKEFAVKYADEGLAIVNISIDKDRDAWLKALDEEQMPWTNLYDVDGKIKSAYYVTGIPSVFLIEAATGKVVFEKLWGDAIGQNLKEVFGY